MKIGVLLKEYRDKNGLSMQEFADKSGLSKGYISMLESGRHPQNNREIIPSIETVQKIATVMGLSVDELLESVDNNQLINISHKNLARVSTGMLLKRLLLIICRMCFLQMITLRKYQSIYMTFNCASPLKHLLNSKS
ncbi:MAG: helix-turn-helix domain-containing protein [Christensenellales bacterium]|jgi:transcriptional regulator with XRE-family HTH domain